MTLTPYLSKLITYHEAHKRSREGFSVSYISTHLGLNWRTTKRLLSIPDDRQYETMPSAAHDQRMFVGPV